MRWLPLPLAPTSWEVVGEGRVFRQLSGRKQQEFLEFPYLPPPAQTQTLKQLSKSKSTHRESRGHLGGGLQQAGVVQGPPPGPAWSAVCSGLPRDGRKQTAG